MNVKSFLAGKAGFCPHCNAKVQIPLTSTRQSDKETDGQQPAPGAAGPTQAQPIPAQAIAMPVQSQAASPSASVANSPAPTTLGAQSVPVAQPLTQAVAQALPNVPIAKPVAPASPGPSHVQPQAATNQPIVVPNGPASMAPIVAPVVPAVPAAPVAPAPVDPIAAAPQAVWYVRPTSGGQYGPATSDVMRQWLDQGRVAVDTLVWQEGWPEWRMAGGVFPCFASH